MFFYCLWMVNGIWYVSTKIDRYIQWKWISCVFTNTLYIVIHITLNNNTTEPYAVTYLYFKFTPNEQWTMNREPRTKSDLNTTYNFNWILFHISYCRFLHHYELTIISRLFEDMTLFPHIRLLLFSCYCSGNGWPGLNKVKSEYMWIGCENLYLLLLLKHLLIFKCVSFLWMCFE